MGGHLVRWRNTLEIASAMSRLLDYFSLAASQSVHSHQPHPPPVLAPPYILTYIYILYIILVNSMCLSYEFVYE